MSCQTLYFCLSALMHLNYQITTSWSYPKPPWINIFLNFCCRSSLDTRALDEACPPSWKLVSKLMLTISLWSHTQSRGIFFLHSILMSLIVGSFVFLWVTCARLIVGLFTPNRIPHCMYSGCKVASNSGHQGCLCLCVHVLCHSPETLVFCLPPPVPLLSFLSPISSLYIHEVKYISL